MYCTVLYSENIKIDLLLLAFLLCKTCHSSGHAIFHIEFF